MRRMLMGGPNLPPEGSMVQGNVTGTAHDPTSDVMGRHVGDPGFSGSIDGSIGQNHGQGQGFMESMGMTPQLAAGMHRTAPVAPPPAWAYQPGQGAVWQTPERTINPDGKDLVSQNWNMTNSSSPWSGNRI